MESRAVMILAVVVSFYHKIVSDAELNVIPRDTEVKINDSTYMNCSTSLQADLVQWRHGSNYVYTGISFLQPYNDGRFSVDINASTGACNLVIQSVQRSDAGQYKCVEDEGFGLESTSQLIVLDANPICKSNMHSEGVIGPNSCDIKAEEVKLSCSIKYHGNIAPILQWKASGDNQSSIDGRINATSNNNEVTYTLTMKSTLGMNNSSFVCQTTRTSDKPYSCSSVAVNILYVFNSEVEINTTLNDQVSCFANTSSQSCSYKWRWFSGDDSTTESDDHILKPKKVGWHRCEATCSLRNESCTVESMYAMVYSEAATNSNLLMALLMLLVILMALIIGVIIYIWRKQQIRKSEPYSQEKELDQQQGLLDGLPDMYKSDLVLFKTIKTTPAKDAKKSIFGLTILDNELFVVSERSSKVEVYDSITLSFSRSLNLKELIDPWDIGSCNRNKCLYIFDFKGNEKLNDILRVDPNGKLIKNWSTGEDHGWGLSVTDESNVILTILLKNKLNEYSPNGQLIREINLSSEADIFCPSRAIKLTDGNFIVSHGSTKDDLHRVCIVDADGKLKKSFGGNFGSNIGQMNEPFHLSLDGNGIVMVADRENSRVLLLDSDLKLRREILSKEKHELRYPTRILLDELNGRLFVVDNKWKSEGRILIFKFSASLNDDIII